MDIKRLSQIGTIINFPKGELIFQQGEIGGCLYILLKGSVNVVLNSIYDGKEILVSVIKEGNIFGEMALLSNSRRTASIRTTENITCLKINQSEFDEFISYESEFVVKMLTSMANRYYATKLKSDGNEENENV